MIVEYFIIIFSPFGFLSHLFGSTTNIHSGTDKGAGLLDISRVGSSIQPDARL